MTPGSGPFREVVTPEGVPLRFAVARVGDRVGAFAIDCVVIGAALVAVLFLALVLAAGLRGMGLAFGLLAFFLLRNFYFTWFECRSAGATPGKRLLGLRVIDAHGGMLTAEAVFARNFMREIELFLPLVAALVPAALWPDLPGWARFSASAWLFVFALLPLFNRDHLRAGDLVAGTLVVRAPKTILLVDLSASAYTSEARAAPTFSFTVEQLDLYGIQELQVLETLLRQETRRRGALEGVARKIQEKIGWAPPSGEAFDNEAFLRAFYTAQRARLEHRLLLGERREAKKAGALIRRP